MSKPCAQCQTMNDDAAPACYACGAPFYAPVQTQQYNAPPPPQQYSQPYGQPQDGYRQPAISAQPYQQQPYGQSPFGYTQPPAPVKDKKKTMRTMLIVAGAIAVVVIAALFILIPRFSAGVSDADSFFKALESGVYGYDMRYVTTNGEEIWENKGFVYSDGKQVVFATYGSDGEFEMRAIYNYGTEESWEVFDSKESYFKSTIINVVYTHGVPDFRSGKSETGSGTTEYNGEKLQYIDYDLDSNEFGDNIVRVFMKGSKVYALQTTLTSYTHTFYLTEFYSSPPTKEHFAIPDHYVDVRDED